MLCTLFEYSRLSISIYELIVLLPLFTFYIIVFTLLVVSMFELFVYTKQPYNSLISNHLSFILYSESSFEYIEVGLISELSEDYSTLSI